MDNCSQESNNTFSSVIKSLTPIENMVRIAVLLRLAKGLSTSSKDLAVLGNLTGEKIPPILQRLSELDLVHGDPKSGKITVAYPFSGIPTAYRITVAKESQTYAMCAIDALGIAHMMKTETKIETQCAHCGNQIRLHLTPEILEAVPNTVVVGVEQSGAQSSCCSTGNSSYATDCCPGIQFYCSKKHWELKNSAGHGVEIPLIDANTYAKNVFEHIL